MLWIYVTFKSIKKIPQVKDLLSLRPFTVSSDSEDEDQEAAVDVEEEDFTVQVKGGEIQKMKFDNMHQVF